jgi:hypothetical protein
VKIAEPIGVGEASYLGVLHDPEYPSVVECIAEFINSEKIFTVREESWMKRGGVAVLGQLFYRKQRYKIDYGNIV